MRQIFYLIGFNILAKPVIICAIKSEQRYIYINNTQYRSNKK